MSYKVVIRRNSDGQKRVYISNLEWDDSTFWWTEGNGGCDCNRKRFFERVADPDWAGEAPCWTGPEPEYSILEARLSDGTIIPLED